MARHVSPEVRKSIHDETIADLVDCGLGIVFAAAAILSVISFLGGHSLILGAAALSGLVSGTLFVRCWTRKGAFRELGASKVAETVSHEA